MPQIVPAILEKTKEDFNRTLSAVVKLPNLERVQVDFGDGKFIQSQLLSAGDMDTLNPSFHWEAHLMCKAPNDFLDYQICGFKTLLLHYEAFPSTADFKKTMGEAKAMGFKVGAVINPDTKVSVLKDIEADEYLIMSVIPGKQGQAFIPETLDRIKELRALKPHAVIEVDGGVNETNIKSIKEAGADLICVGSALVKSADAPAAYEKLMMAMNS